MGRSAGGNSGEIEFGAGKPGCPKSRGQDGGMIQALSAILRYSGQKPHTQSRSATAALSATPPKSDLLSAADKRLKSRSAYCLRWYIVLLVIEELPHFE